MTCDHCKCTQNDACTCETCMHQVSKYCHVCRVLYGILYRSHYFSNLSQQEEIEKLNARNRMGLQ